jgi:hypothetical protein
MTCAGTGDRKSTGNRSTKSKVGQCSTGGFALCVRGGRLRNLGGGVRSRGNPGSVGGETMWKAGRSTCQGRFVVVVVLAVLDKLSSSLYVPFPGSSLFRTQYCFLITV